MLIELSFTAWSSDVKHVYTFSGDTETETVYPDEMVQDGETYRIEWGNVPDELKNELREMRDWEFVAE
jgi:hypothetical protein